MKGADISMKTQKIIAALLISSIATGLAGCSSQPDETSATTALEVTTTTTAESTTEETTEETEAPLPTAADIDYLEGYTQFEVTSEDLVDGAWAQIVSYTEEGENMSPQLSWEPVEGATVYCVYMIDLSSWNWMHWKSNDIYETELPRGWASSMEYMGPYPPPGGTHTYDVYVVAMRNPVDRIQGVMNNYNEMFETFITNLDTDDEGNTGNIVAYGRLSGTYTHNG